MSYIVTVVFESDVENLEQVEREHPEILAGVGAAAQGRMVSHTRYVRDGYTMDVDHYESREAYEAFVAEAGPFIRQYADFGGAVPVDTLWQRHES
ncbi:hypothetical protein [Nocardia sp. NPDC059239]|uniref:hypothetical protein n=1 Tax=unclassified Nocardia TaxID=2637762 RepID=UPI0036C47509